jgi:peptidyl-tRNA hydrolase, PTH1 family
VVVDDLDIPFGRLRVRADGSAGGHNGLKSIISDIGTEEFPRLRVGIGRPNHSGGRAIGHVLGAFSAEEKAQAEEVFGAAADAVELWLDDGILATMNAVNGVPSVIS